MNLNKWNIVTGFYRFIYYYIYAKRGDFYV